MSRTLRLRVLGSLMGLVWVVCQADGVTSGSVTPSSGSVPDHTIIVKGAWPSASDSTTPLPEGGRLAEGGYQNDYFGLALHFSANWRPGLEGPPPSDSGSYVLAQIMPAPGIEAEKPGYLLITAQDAFFSVSEADGALGLVDFTQGRLDRSIYQIEQEPEQVQLAGRSFVRFAYRSRVAGLQWTILAIEIRCHVVEFIFVSANPKESDLAQLLDAMNTITLPSTAGLHGAGGGEVPLCIKGYANTANVVRSEEPILTTRRYNRIPVRIIIDAQGKVKHIHFLRAFPDQAKAITDALSRWRFKPYRVDGKPVEVETGIMFGRGTSALPAAAPGPYRATVAAGS